MTNVPAALATLTSIVVVAVVPSMKFLVRGRLRVPIPRSVCLSSRRSSITECARLTFFGGFGDVEREDLALPCGSCEVVGSFRVRVSLGIALAVLS